MKNKEPFHFPTAFTRIREAVQSFPRAALFQLYDEGFTSTFQQLAACIISIRTYDETTIPVARQLLQTAGTPDEMISLSIEEIERLIKPSTFYTSKAPQLHEIARKTVEEWDGELPCNPEVLLSLGGVGPKCANLVLGIACKQPQISVDVHVHRIVNRWGIISTKSPSQSTLALEKLLPHEHWIEINELLVPFGKHICTRVLPRCSTCPVLEMCQQVNVTKHR